MTTSARATSAAELAVSISREFEAPCELVYRLWTDSQLMRRWSCPEGFNIVSADAELRVGGAWHAHMRSPEGQDYRLQGVYRDIVRNKRLVFTHAWLDEAGKPGPETLVTVTFTERDGRTRMDFVQTGFDSAQSRDGHSQGWNQCVAKFGALLESIKGSDREIVATRLLSAPRALVFRCFGDPDNIGTWWGPNGFTTTTRRMEFRIGGVWEYVMHGPDGTDYPNYVRYTEIVEPERICHDHGTSAEHPDMFKAIITLDDEDGKTRVTLRLILTDPAQRDALVAFGAVEGAWQNLARLEAYLAARNT